MLKLLADERPVLLAVDDAQWLDAASRRILEFAIRRASGALGVLVAVRAELGMQRVRRTMTLSNDQKSFQAADTVEVLAPDGTVVASIKGGEAGRRLGV